MPEAESSTVGCRGRHADCWSGTHDGGIGHRDARRCFHTAYQIGHGSSLLTFRSVQHCRRGAATDYGYPFRGTNQSVASNHALGRFQIVGIPAAPRGTPQVEVTFTITERQILISARDLTRKTDLEIQRVSGDTKL